MRAPPFAPSPACRGGLGRGQRLAMTMPLLMLHRNKFARAWHAARRVPPPPVSQSPPLAEDNVAQPAAKFLLHLRTPWRCIAQAQVMRDARNDPVLTGR